MIYQSDETAGFYYYNGSIWTNVEGVVPTLNGVLQQNNSAENQQIKNARYLRSMLLWFVFCRYNHNISYMSPRFAVSQAVMAYEAEMATRNIFIKMFRPKRLTACLRDNPAHIHGYNKLTIQSVLGISLFRRLLEFLLEFHKLVLNLPNLMSNNTCNGMSNNVGYKLYHIK